MSDNGLSFALDYKKFGSFVVDVDMIKAAGYTSFLKVYKMRFFQQFQTTVVYIGEDPKDCGYSPLGLLGIFWHFSLIVYHKM